MTRTVRDRCRIGVRLLRAYPFNEREVERMIRASGMGLDPDVIDPNWFVRNPFNWITRGIEYGYPECCILLFSLGGVDETASVLGTAASDIGFVACPLHTRHEAARIATHIRRGRRFRPFGLGPVGR